MTLCAENLSVKISDKLILDDLSFICRTGEVTAIIGENGAGKSTLINCLAGTSNFDGEISLDGQSVKQLNLAQLAQQRAVLPQHSSMNFPLCVREVVRLAMSLSQLSTRDQNDIIDHCLTMVDATEFIDRNYLHLSGGEKQRVQLARVLAQLRAFDNDGSRFLFLDEPTSALDLKHQYATLTMLRELCTKASIGDIGALIIVHDLNLASLYCDRIILLKNGRLVAHDTPHRVFQTNTIIDTFGIDVLVDRHPDTNKPYLIPRL